MYNREYYQKLTDKGTYSIWPFHRSFDEYGVAYSSDGKVLLDASHIEAECYSIREGTEVIASYAFDEASVRSIIVPEGVVALGENAFANMRDLEEVSLPQNSLTYIGDCAFYSCEKLKRVAVPEGIDALVGTFQDCSQLEDVALPNSLRFIDSAFCECYALKNILIPEGVEEIKNEAFEYSGLRHVKLPSTIRLLDSAFSFCRVLESVSWPMLQSSNVIIGNASFSFCENLKRIELPDGITEIQECVFGSCSLLREIVLPRSLKKFDSPQHWSRKDKHIISQSDEFVVKNDMLLSKDETVLITCFNRNNSIQVPDSIEYIGRAAFADCDKLVHISLGQNLKSIGLGAFSNCFNLRSIEFSSRLEVIKMNAFIYCQSLVEVVLPESVRVIEPEAFCHCFSLEKLVLPCSLKKIERSIVSYCNKLRHLELPDKVGIITERAFERNEFLEEIALSKDIEVIGKEAFSKCYSLEKLRLNDGLKRIKCRAFYNCYSLYIDYLPASLELVEEGAFYGVQLSEEVQNEVEVRFPLALFPGQQYEAEVDLDSFMDLAQNKYIKQNYEMLE